MIKTSCDKLIGLAGMNEVSNCISLLVLHGVAVTLPEVWPEAGIALFSCYDLVLAVQY